MRRGKGFTLIEMMVVIAILGILAATAFPTYKTFRRRAVGSEATTIMKQLIDAEVMYYLAHNKYFPDPGQGDIFVAATDNSGKIDIQQVRQALKVTLPVGHFLDFRIRNDGAGNVWIWIDANFPIFRDGSSGIHACMDSKGEITYF